ncbi:hypothetical protein ADIS_0085 [Lunatimonas lonarensis]|uniref:Uncharacterized protein n=1 Tax=Lunatimonas lonarensis TaxID=1232681 RepID=R7ZZ77_9BACT|nr:hypothetical protein ADIS_0085 [Lunatimonas lonarensis]
MVAMISCLLNREDKALWAKKARDWLFLERPLSADFNSGS